MRSAASRSPPKMVVASGAKPFIGYTVVSTTDHVVAGEVIYPVPGFPIYDSMIRGIGATPVPIYLREGLRLRPGRSAQGDHT
ncbi:MAG: hypothetical protein U0V87_11595 [Acidobacteriota bacterium]